MSLPELLRWIWSHAKCEVWAMGLAMVAATAVSSLSAVSLLYASKFINAVGEGRHGGMLIRLGGLIVAIFVGRSILGLIASTFGALASTNIRRNLEVACVEHLSGLAFRHLEGAPAGRLSAALLTEVPMVSGLLGVLLRSFVRAPIAILMILAALWINSPVAALAALATFPFVFVGLRTLSTLAKAASKRTFDSLSRMYSKMNEHIAGIRVVWSLGLMDWYTSEMRELSKQVAQTSRHGAILTAAQRAIQEMISLVVLMAFLWWLALRVIEGTMQVGQALIVPAAIVMIRDEALRVSAGVMSLRKSHGAAARLCALLQVETQVMGTQELAGPLAGIRLVDVGFQYPDGEHVIDGVDLTLKPGGIIVLAGESGAGKSTLCDLCLRLRLPTKGQILYNDTDLASLTEASLRVRTALVEQEPYLFEGTIEENLLLADESASEDDMWEALRRANAEGFIRALDAGLESQVGPGGVKLSVGQKQRIVLARALLKRPEFLVLDEFTGSLDPHNEAKVLETIVELAKQAIVLCTTHRTSIMEQARVVYVLEGKQLRQV